MTRLIIDMGLLIIGSILVGFGMNSPVVGVGIFFVASGLYSRN